MRVCDYHDVRNFTREIYTKRLQILYLNWKFYSMQLQHIRIHICYVRHTYVYIKRTSARARTAVSKGLFCVSRQPPGRGLLAAPCGRIPLRLAINKILFFPHSKFSAFRGDRSPISDTPSAQRI